MADRELRVIGKLYSDGESSLVANDRFPNQIERVVTVREHWAALAVERDKVENVRDVLARAPQYTAVYDFAGDIRAALEGSE